MPRLISRAGGHPLRFQRSGSDILLQNEYFGLQRLIHMDAIMPDVLERTPLGYSIGVWEDEELVITTTAIDWPWFQLYGLEGVPQSEEVVLKERFRLDSVDNSLYYSITVTDPTNFTRSMTAEDYIWFRWEPGLDFLPYECVLSH